jgi:adenylate kinase
VLVSAVAGLAVSAVAGLAVSAVAGLAGVGKTTLAVAVGRLDLPEVEKYYE